MTQGYLLRLELGRPHGHLRCAVPASSRKPAVSRCSTLVASGTFGHLRVDVEFTSSAQPVYRNSRARLVSRYSAERVLRSMYGRAVDGENEIAGLQSSLLGRAAHVEIGNQDTALGETVLGGLLARDV